MSNNTRQLFLACFLIVLSDTASADVSGGIATDGTLGAMQTLTGADVVIPQSLGTTAGTNLFHSFAEFNIAAGQTVTFTGADTLQNVFSRVTGSDVTEIDGQLKSSIAHAAFYFINPNGMTFGPNAQVDVPGAFYIATADKIDFPNGTAFHADNRPSSTLSSEAPAAFGFLETSQSNNGLIAVDGTQLAVKTGQTLALAAGEIKLENGAAVVAPEGEIRLAAAGTGETDVALDGHSQAAMAGIVDIDSSTVDSSGNGAGTIIVRGGEVDISGSGLLANNTGNKDAAFGKGVDIAADRLTVKNDSGIRSNVAGQGKGGNITITTASGFDVRDSTVRAAVVAGAAGQGGNIRVNAKNLSIDKPGNKEAAINVVSADKASGSAGSVAVNVTEQLALRNQSYISSDTYGAGNTGPVTIVAGHLQLDSKAQIESSAWEGSSGNAGDVSVKADTIDLNDGAWIYALALGTGKAGNVNVEAQGQLKMTNGGSIQNSTFAAGNGGDVNVKAGAIALDNQNAKVTEISSSTFSSGKAGNVHVDSAGKLEIINGAVIVSNTGASGDAGNVDVKASAITVNGNSNDKQSGIYSQTFFGSGKAGNVSVESSGPLEMINRGIIGSSTMSSGNSGNVSVKAGSLEIDAGNTHTGFTGIFSGPADNCSAGDSCTGKAGTIDVDTREALVIRNGGSISNNTFGDGDAGRIGVKAGTLTIAGSNSTLTGIYANSFSRSGAQGGNLDIAVRDSLSIMHGGVIDTSSYGTGKAGDIAVNSGRLQIDGFRMTRLGYPDSSGILSTATGGSNGQTGNINIKAGHAVRLSNYGKISIENNGIAIDPASIQPGTIRLYAHDIDMVGSEITSNSTGNVAAGKITINFSHWLTMDPSFISTTANTGNGGSITVNGGEGIYLQDSGFRTTVSGADSNGGDIFTTAKVLAMNSGLIQANAVGGSGGNITLSLESLIPSGNSLIKGGAPLSWQPFAAGFNVIQAASQTGISGEVNVTAPQLNLSGVIANLGGPQFDTDIIAREYCGWASGSSLARTGAGGLKPKSGEQLWF